MRLVLLAVVFGVLVGARRVRERRVYDLKGRLHRSGPRIVCSLAAMLPVIPLGCAATSSRAAMADRPRAVAVALPGIPRDTTSAVATVAMATTNQSVQFYGYDASSMATTALQFVATNTPGEPGTLNPSAVGPGLVPRDKRAKARAQTRGQKAAQLEAQGGLCANCGNPETVDGVDGHHYPDRHADGGKDFVEVCKLCHKWLHGKNP